MTDIFTLLKEQVDPMIKNYSPDTPLSQDPVIGSFTQEPVSGFQQPQAGELDIYMYKSMPAVIVGDTYRYKSGSKAVSTGKIKFKKVTQQVVINQDEAERIQQLGDASIVKGMVDHQLKTNHATFINQVQRWCVNRWEGVTTDLEYDSTFISALQMSTGGTISNPSSLEGGSALDLSAINVSGTNQSAHALTSITLQTEKAMYKEDYFTKMPIPIEKIAIYMHGLSFKIISKNTEILNSTTGQRSESTQLKILQDMGYQVIPTSWADSDYTGATTVTSEWIFVSDPKGNIKCLLAVGGEPGSDGWSGWAERYTQGEEYDTIFYEKHRNLEFGIYNTPYHLWTSATADAFYKLVHHTKVTPFENT